MVPTALGIALIKGLRRCDPSLVEPKLRAGMEAQVVQIAQGERSKAEVLSQNLRTFAQKFAAFADPPQFERVMRPLFVNEAATQSLIAASIAAQQEAKASKAVRRDLGQLAKVEAQADIAAELASQAESVRRAEHAQRSRWELLGSADASQQILGALFSG